MLSHILSGKKKMTKNNKVKCRWCKKSGGVIKYYIIADDIENPKPYHPSCIRLLDYEVIKKLPDMYAVIEGKPINEIKVAEKIKK